MSLPAVCLPLLLVLTPGQDEDRNLTRVNAWKIEFPVMVDPERINEIKQIHLFVSWDRGKTWKKVTTVLPTQSSVRYTAERDGEAWFMVQAIDNKGKADPEKPDASYAQKVL